MQSEFFVQKTRKQITLRDLFYELCMGQKLSILQTKKQRKIKNRVKNPNIFFFQKRSNGSYSKKVKDFGKKSMLRQVHNMIA